MRWHIDDAPVFIAVVDRNGISAAAEQLQMPKSTVSRCISRLEEGLRVRLLARNSRRLRVTAEGEVFYRHAVQIMEQVSLANAQMADLTSVPSGRLTVALPIAFSREIVAGKLSRFHERYPLINLEVIVTSHNVDVIREQIDIALVIGHLNDSELIAQKLMETSLIWISSPEYAKANQLDDTVGIDDLLTHVQVCERRYGQSRLVVYEKGAKEVISLAHVIHTNDPIMVREMVVDGAGVSMAPLIYCRRHIGEGNLLQVFPHIEIGSTAVISAVYPDRSLGSTKNQCFIDFVRDIIKEA